MTLRPDTIAAIATATGPGAIALLRLSGSKAFRIAREVCVDLPESPQPRTAHLTEFRDPESGDALDRGLVTFFPGPASYTGEDVVELSGHGGWWAPARLLDLLLERGARAAEPGEGTRRAYLNGKLDLIQAEAVADLVEGASPALHRVALTNLDRGLSRRVSELREGLVELKALLVHHIDFPDEDEPATPLDEVVRAARERVGAMERILSTAPEGELLREGARTVLAGRPNSGKSSLFNALLGDERAIVTATPGTTRDAVEATVAIGGYPFRLVDTAGLRETTEEVERLGIEVARRHLARADLVLFCAEAGRLLTEDERRFLDGVEAPVLHVRTMVDRTEAAGVENGSEVAVSARSGEGLDELRGRLPHMVFSGLVRAASGHPVVTRVRQRRALERSCVAVEAFARAVEGGIPPEVAAAHLSEAETALEELLGVIPSEEVLDRVFSRFCIGK